MGPGFLGTGLLAGDRVRHYIPGTSVGREAKETKVREKAPWRMCTCEGGFRGRRVKKVDSVRNHGG